MEVTGKSVNCNSLLLFIAHCDRAETALETVLFLGVNKEFYCAVESVRPRKYVSVAELHTVSLISLQLHKVCSCSLGF